jgi:hypothetical protein
MHANHREEIEELILEILFAAVGLKSARTG